MEPRRLPTTVVRERVPGAAPVSAHSRWTAVADAAPLEAWVVDPPALSGDAPASVPLDGEWLRHAYPDEPATPPVGARVDDAGWDRVVVPDNFGREPALAAHFGPVFYRRRLAAADGARWRLAFDAVDYLADVWLDDAHLGRHEGFFAPFAFDVGSRVRDGSVLTVRVQDPFEDLDGGDTFFVHAKRVIKGTLKYHDSRPGGLPGRALTPGWTARLGQSMTTGGITGSVRLESSGPVRIDALFATPLDVAAGRVHVAVVVTNVDAAPVDATLVLAVAGIPTAVAATVPSGAGRVDVEVEIPFPRAWWPASHADLGTPALYALAADAVVGGAVSDRRTVRFGLRTASIDGDPPRVVLNGRPVFVQAANYIPRQHVAGVGPEAYRTDFGLAAAAHLNSVGVHAHLQPSACYDAADEAGMLVFQDFPLQWRYDSGVETNPGFVDLACRQIAEMAYGYWNHPSIVYWACHNEPMAQFFPGQRPDAGADADNQVLDEALERRLRHVDPRRPIHRASGIGDLHVYDGSLAGGNVYDVRKRRGWFVSEYGFWTVGPRAHRWNDQGWPPDAFQMRQWLSRLSFGPNTMNFAGLPDRYPSREAWAQATELYGTFLARYQTEWFRMHRGDPYFAIRWHFLVDWWGWAGGGLVDVGREPKATYRALAAALRPLLVATSWPATVVAPDTPLRLPVTVVNERRDTTDVAVEWTWRRTPRAIVIGVDEESARRFPVPVPGTPGAMVALAAGDADGEVCCRGRLDGRVGPESAVEIGVVDVAAAAEPFVATTLELVWADGAHTERNAFTVLAAPAGWFCGPGAFAVGADGIRRLGVGA